MGLFDSFIKIKDIKEYLNKIFKHEAALFQHKEDEFDVILMKRNGNIQFYIWSRKENRTLRQISDEDVEKILTS